MPHRTVVLVVEDEVLIRVNTVTQLEDRGFAVLEVGTAAEAIELLQSHPEIEVLFTDVDMPGDANGLMLAAAVRDRWPPIKIIVTSGNRDVSRGEMPDESRFLAKPYAADEVALAVHEMLR